MKVTYFLLKRIVLSIPILLGITLFSFILGLIAPSDPALVLLTMDGQSEPSASELMEMRHKLGLDKPYYFQFYLWIEKLLQGDLGNSYLTSLPVASSLVERLPVTLTITASALLFLILLAIPLGVYTAFKAGTSFDRITRTLIMAISAIPSFWLALVGIYYFSETWQLLPTSGYGSFKQILLPSLVLALGTWSTMLRLQRSSILEESLKAYTLTERSQGLSKQRILWRHIYPNALTPIVTLIGTYSIGLLGGSVIVESIFSLPGLGSFVLEGIRGRDYPVVQGYVVFIGCIVVLINLLVDFSYYLLNPKSRGDL